MATNFLMEGEVVPLVAPAGGVVSGLGYLIGAAFVVALGSAAVGATFQGKRRGVFRFPKAGAVNWVQGAKVYWDNTARNITNVSAGNTFVGHSMEARVNGDTTVAVILVPGGS
jgi:predicted RecA/RadA family phage recombinase